MWCETINYDYTPVGTAPHGTRRFCNLNGVASCVVENMV